MHESCIHVGQIIYRQSFLLVRPIPSIQLFANATAAMIMIMAIIMIPFSLSFIIIVLLLTISSSPPPIIIVKDLYLPCRYDVSIQCL